MRSPRYSATNTFEHGGEHQAPHRNRSSQYNPTKRRSVAAKKDGGVTPKQADEKKFFGETFDPDSQTGIPTSITTTSPTTRRTSNMFDVSAAKKAATGLSPKRKEGRPLNTPTSATKDRKASNMFDVSAAKHAANHLSPKRDVRSVMQPGTLSPKRGSVSSPKRNSITEGDGGGRRSSNTPKNGGGGGGEHKKHKFQYGRERAGGTHTPTPLTPACRPSEVNFCVPVVGFSLHFDPYSILDHDEAGSKPSTPAKRDRKTGFHFSIVYE